MSLTNYLMQSVFGVLLLWPWGLGLEQRLVGWPRMAVLVVFFAIQILYSRWWFERFRFGPVEWVWRTLTWLRPQPMRVRPPALAPVGAGARVEAAL
jgi:uncharacterized protein